MDEATCYRIRVVGRVDGKWSNRLGGLRVRAASGSYGEAETVLVGFLADQSALAGVLNTLYELHLPIISVEALESIPEGPGGANSTPGENAR